MESPRGNSSSPPPFLIKTYEMVDDPATDSTVSWSPTNVSFVVWNQLEFARDLLPKYFKHNNFSSFVRQLNTYGFRKIDPDQWEFANEDFIRGEKHLLKNIHRRKPVYSHSPHNQGSSSGPLSEAQKQDLEEEIERLKQEKAMLVNELQKHVHKQHGMDHQMQSLEERLQVLENRHRSLMAFLTQIVQEPRFLSNLVHDSGLLSKKRRLPKIDYFNEDTAVEDNQIVTFQQPLVGEKSDYASIHMLDMEPFEKIESSLNSLENFFRGVSQAFGDDMCYDSIVACLPTDVLLTEMNASSVETGASLHSLLPNLYPSSPCLGDIHSSPETAECMSHVDTRASPQSLLHNLYPSSRCLGDIHSSPETAECMSHVETPAIPATENQIDSRIKVAEIDVNLEPAATEVVSSRDQTTSTTASTMPTGVNDVFWQQFLTEIPGSSDTTIVQLKRRDSDDEHSEGKIREVENMCWNRGNVDHLVEKMGNLISVEKT
ncbi:hypothetical protein GW17_00056751 [Ensete ventricosum]|nr:hypothetical protein GW17_00056751 [Ensete ventricosum]